MISSRSLLRSTTALLACSLVAACTGEAGPTGPQGPEGAAGPQGIEGPQGPTGTANVISGSLLVEGASWSAGTEQVLLDTAPGSISGGDPARYRDITIPEITADVLGGGAIQIWMEVTSGNWATLPYSFKHVLSGYERFYEVEVSEGAIRLLFLLRNINDPETIEDPAASPQPDRNFRWVIIPPAAAGPSASPLMTSLPLESGPDETLRELQRRGYVVDATP